MATTKFSGFSQLQAVRAIRHSVRLLFSKYLLATNVAISVGLSGTGDILQQHYDILRHQTSNAWDAKRTRNMALSGASVGAVCHYWYIWLDRKLPGRVLKTVIKKVIVDQVIFSPVIISVFFVTMGALERSTFHRIRREIYEKGSQLYLAEWMIWPPAQMVNFYVLPTRYRVLYDNVISLGFDVYTSYLKHKVELKDGNENNNEDVNDGKVTTV